MEKKEIFKYFNNNNALVTNKNNTAFNISVTSDDIDVLIIIPFEVHEIYYEAKDKNRKTLIKDWHDFYGENELEDFKEYLHDIADILDHPKLRVSNNGKTVEAFGFQWYYFFGEFNGK